MLLFSLTISDKELQRLTSPQHCMESEVKYAVGIYLAGVLHHFGNDYHLCLDDIFDIDREHAEYLVKQLVGCAAHIEEARRQGESEDKNDCNEDK